MPDLRCTACGETAGYADAQIADALRTCGGDRVGRHTAMGQMHNGTKHDWEEC